MICFAWNEFPQYAARCIGAFVKATDEKVVVVGTRPRVPIEGMEDLCGCQVYWVDPDKHCMLSQFIGEIPRIIFVSGWSVSAFNRYADEVKKAGGKVIAMIDNNFSPSIKEIIKGIRFKFYLKKRYDGYFVPGKSGERLLNFYGVRSDQVARGMYSADASLFTNGIPLCEREKKIIYVGQFIERKNVLRMVDVFKNASKDGSNGWTLSLYGSGKLKEELRQRSCNSVQIHSFVQPEQLAGLYQSARVLCLPSLEEHWGLVVHEAALCGCILMLSENVGAAEDLLGAENGFTFNPKDEEGMMIAFRRVMEMPEDALEKAQLESLRYAKATGIDVFVAGAKRLISL